MRFWLRFRGGLLGFEAPLLDTPTIDIGTHCSLGKRWAKGFDAAIALDLSIARCTHANGWRTCVCWQSRHCRRQQGWQEEEEGGQLHGIAIAVDIVPRLNPHVEYESRSVTESLRVGFGGIGIPAALELDIEAWTFI